MLSLKYPVVLKYWNYIFDVNVSVNVWISFVPSTFGIFEIISTSLWRTLPKMNEDCGERFESSKSQNLSTKSE